MGSHRVHRAFRGALRSAHLSLNPPRELLEEVLVICQLLDTGVNLCASLQACKVHCYDAQDKHIPKFWLPFDTFPNLHVTESLHASGSAHLSLYAPWELLEEVLVICQLLQEADRDRMQAAEDCEGDGSQGVDAHKREAGFKQIQQLVRGEGGDARQQSCARSFQDSPVRLQPARQM